MELNEEQLEVLNQLKICWSENNNLRFGQMLAIIIKSGKSQFFMPDKELIQRIKEFVEPLI